jgi:phosphoserine phosphatase RsbU/P
MAQSLKNPFLSRLAFLLGGMATLVLVGALLWAGFTSPLSSRMPVPSPDGRYFAYFNRRAASSFQDNPGFDLVLALPQGKLLGRIATDPGKILWSNANHLVSLDPAGRQAAVIANADERFVMLARITLVPGSDPQWAPDGNKLAFIRDSSTGAQITVYDVQQPQMYAVTLPADFHLKSARLVAWSPGSEQLYFLNAPDKESVLYELAVRDGKLREVARGKAGPEDRLPQMSPDGTRIFWGPPENTIIDVQSAERTWSLPSGAKALWWPWSRDSHEFYFTRPESSANIYSHNFSSSSDLLVLSGVSDNGFFDADGNNYYFRQAVPSSESGEETAGGSRRRPADWVQAGRGAIPQVVEGVELWPWEKTLDGMILARRDSAGRVRYGLYDPDTHRLAEFRFPTDGDDLLRQVKSYRLVIATVALFTLLAAIVFVKRFEAKSGRAFPILLFLAMALGCGIVVGDSSFATEAIIPYRITLTEIGNEGWGITNSLPHVVFRQAQIIMAWLWALLPLAILNFALSFPERSTFLKSQGVLKEAMLGVAAIPLLMTILGRLVPKISLAATHYVVMVVVAAAACVWALGLTAGYRQPPDKSGRHATLWFSAALGLVAIAYMAHMQILPDTSGQLAGVAPGVLPFTFFVLAAWIAPSAMAYAVAARKPVSLSRFLSNLLMEFLMGLPALAVFAITWAIAGLVASGSLWAYSPVAILIAVLVAVLSILPFRGRLRKAIEQEFDRSRLDSRERLEDVARHLPHTVDREALAIQLEEVLTKTLHARWSLLFVVDRGSRKLAFLRGKTALSTEMRHVTFALDEPLCEYLKSKDPVFEPLLASSSGEMEEVMASAGERLKKLQAEVVLGLRRSDLLGLIVLGPKTTRDLYDRDEIASLCLIANETTSALENIELFEMASRGRDERKELEVASDIQSKLLPTHFPKLTVGQLAGCCYPARTTGGDYYDFVELPGRKIGLIMCDVPGKGMAAALQAASLEKILGLQIPASPNLGELVQKVNRELVASSGTGKHSTLFYGVFDSATRRLDYINAGHPLPLLLTAQGSQFLDSTGMPLGLFPEISHQSRQMILPPGSMLLIYSDGAVDARNVSGESFGKDRLVAALREDLASDADRALGRLVAAIRDFEGDAMLEDDQTFLLLKVYPE